MKQAELLIRKVLEGGTLLSTLGFLGAVLLQIFARFFLEKAPPWTEEVSRLFFVYAMAFAAGLAVQKKEYVHLDLFYNRLSQKGKQVLDLSTGGLTLILFGTLAYFAIPFIQLGSLETSPSLKVQLNWAFLSMLVLGVGICFYTLIELFTPDKP